MSRLPKELVTEAIELRRSIHRNPELGYEELATTELIAEALDVPGISVRRRNGTGLTAEVGSGRACVAFRADIDALPIHEVTGLSFASERPGVMHACGHDAHTAIGIGIARYMATLDVPGRVRFIFQAAEEQFPGGGQALVDEGVVEDVESIVAYHVDPSLEVGKVGLKVGPITSSSDRFSVTLTGPGGHTARPHETVDLLHAAGQMLTELPWQLYRTVDARLPVALVFGQIVGGSADNIIPTEVTLSGTCRVLDLATWESMPERLEDLVQGIARLTGAIAKLTCTRGIAPVVNDFETIGIATAAIGDELGHSALNATYASMGAEDFSSYLQKVPGALLRLGVWDGISEKTALHSAFFDLDERAIEVGIRAGTATLLGLLNPQ